LTCCNDFGAHVELADIETACSYYMFAQARKKDPKVDNFYTNLIKEGKLKQAKAYLKAVKEDEKRVKEETFEILQTRIGILKDKYLKMPYEYYRV
jgi:ribosome-binding factor A